MFSFKCNTLINAQLAGSLQSLTVTRPDIAFATNVICQHMHAPTTYDHQLLKRLLRYIKGTLHYGLPLSKGELKLTTYSDADWAADMDERKFVSGFCTYLGSNLILWSVKKQATVARSSTEAEYRALAAATSDVLWLRRLMADFHVPRSQATSIFCDNISTLTLAHNPVFHARTKHIEIDHHFISDRIRHNTIDVSHISSLDQPADILTKPLSATRFSSLRDKLTIC
ncbi:hypothetical protein KFK09_002249 [Dendrobium nobile]|uniref:Mitochondrial protein n=1 Tax=Dendrobium nobile TaxID=94219 RepID=A0A8T3CAH7_DENNO|nr:hypothetical protein KFK09_002249 [Dendrobium nobile]